MPDGFFTDKNGVVHPINNRGSKKGGGGGAAVAAVALAGLAAAGGGFTSASPVGEAAESVVQKTISDKVENAKRTARQGKDEESWVRLGLKELKKATRADLDCVVNSSGQVRQFFIRTPCRSLKRWLVPFVDTHGDIIVLSIAWLEMYDDDNADRLKRLDDTYGTGSVLALPDEVAGLIGIRFPGQHYDSRQEGSLVVIAEATAGTGHPDVALMDGVAHVAKELPAPR